jgi:acetoin utilization deacetylase AcuC-like enzyme
MKLIHSPLHALHDGGMELHRGELVPCFEMPARVDHILGAFARAGWTVQPPQEHDDAVLAGIHDPGYLAFLRGAWAEWIAEGRDGFMLAGAFPARGLRRDRVPSGLHARLGYYAFDAGSPIVAGTWVAARAAADCALTAADLVAGGERSAYALCRPPGHHAGRSMFGGYCFLNNAALAAQRLRDAGFARVSVLDVDYHHGNGTQDIFWTRDDVQFLSIHGDPETEYPFFLGHADERGEGAGRRPQPQLPLPRGTGWATYAAALDEALGRIAAFAPQALVVSLGVDIFGGDPISSFTLTAADFPRLGARLAALGLPTVLVQEGGYAVAEIGDIVAGVLAAFA